MKCCRACRLDKCLLEGMDPTMVEAEQSAELSQFIQSLYKRRQFLQQQLKEDEEKFCHIDTHLSEHYANLLMHHLCTNYGKKAATFRHAELVELAKSMFFNAERLPEYYQQKCRIFWVDS
ncbi:hypothetical protein niasHT_023053 [Heterodera trifolii]|uniref:Nuclear receptor domain-containing protein n=1 Tax=Heterodera trifolii TaxID=157864 RepID=A0ABD2KFA7_9BILA